jgi:transcriptional regulator with PAS, ATPase and Fis domain
LFYRINVVRLLLPPLRERMEDIPLLVSHFINKQNSLRGKRICGIDQEVLSALMGYSFPGNIRELENIIEYAFVLCPEGDIHLQHLPGCLSERPFLPPECKIDGNPMKSAEIKIITDSLVRNRYNRKAAAADLGMHKSTLFRKIHKLGIILPKMDGRSPRS